MTPVTLLKIYIYSSTSKKCGGTSGGSGCMRAREGSRFIKKLLPNTFVKACLFALHVTKQTFHYGCVMYMYIFFIIKMSNSLI